MPIPLDTNQLDIVAKNLIEIKQQLKLIETTKSFNETVTTWGIIISPLITGLVFFILTKRKEFHYKKSELAGEIYACIYELNRIHSTNTSYQILIDGNSKAIELINDPEFYNKTPDPSYQGKYSNEEYLTSLKIAANEVNQNNIRFSELAKNLRKYVGQYKLYLNKRKRRKFDRLIIPVYRMVSLKYDFEKSKNPKEVDDQIILCQSKELDDFNKKYDDIILSVLDFFNKHV